MTRPLRVFLPLLFIPFLLSAQKESYNWYFGLKAGITFNPNGNPVAVTNSVMSSGKGCASISDSCSGQLHFYTNGDSIINRNHQTMMNGTNLDGSSGSTQSAIIVPSPDGGSGEYFVFTVERSNGLKYSVVDLNLAGGLGAVLPSKKNISLVSPTVEKVTAVRHENQRYMWIITHTLNTNDFYSYLLTDTGLVNAPVVSSTGQIYGSGSQLGYMKASPRGDRIALALTGDKRYDLFDFDNATGVISNGRSSGPTYNFAYGVEFSPDGSKLYVTSNLGLYQYDLETSGPGKALGDSVFLGANPTVALQLGPNGIIYCNEGYKLGAINKANEKGLACNYTANAIGLSNRFASSGLPTFVQSYFSPTFIKAEGFCLGIPTQFTLFSERRIDSVLWNFGEPSSGPQNTSTLVNPTHFYANTGTYSIRVFTYTQKCGLTQIDTVEKEIEIVNLPIPNIDLGNDTVICPGDSLLLWTDGQEPEYLWNDGSSGSELIAKKAGQYWVRAKNDCGALTDSIDINVFSSSLSAELGPDSAICSGQSILLNVRQDNVTYLWQDSSMNYSYLVKDPGTYWVQTEDKCFVLSDTIEISQKAKPTVTLGEDTIICLGTSLKLDVAFPKSTYLWNDGSTESTLEITEEGFYRSSVTNECGSVSDEIYVRTEDCKCFVQVPNAFTPNSDGLNDVLEIKHTCTFLDYSLEIFNRWGELIFRTTSPEVFWEGDQNGKMAGIGLYTYLLKYTSNDPQDSEEHEMRGSINLIK